MPPPGSCEGAFAAGDANGGEPLEGGRLPLPVDESRAEGGGSRSGRHRDWGCSRAEKGHSRSWYHRDSPDAGQCAGRAVWGDACGGSCGRWRAASEASGVPALRAASCKRGTSGVAGPELAPATPAAAMPTSGFTRGPGPQARALIERGGIAGSVLGVPRGASRRSATSAWPFAGFLRGSAASWGGILSELHAARPSFGKQADCADLGVSSVGAAARQSVERRHGAEEAA